MAADKFKQPVQSFTLSSDLCLYMLNQEKIKYANRHYNSLKHVSNFYMVPLCLSGLLASCSSRVAITKSQKYFQAETFTLFCCRKHSYASPLGVLGNHDVIKLPLEILILTVSTSVKEYY